MAEKRKDFRGRNLKDGESQRPDGRYCFKYKNISGKYAYVYAWKLTSTDKTPNGKREDICLRDKEKLIAENLRNGIDSAKAKTTGAPPYIPPEEKNVKGYNRTYSRPDIVDPSRILSDRNV